MINKHCPVEKGDCPCEFSRENLCDYPYSQDMALQDCQNLTFILKTIDDLYKDCPEIEENNVENS
jgi:hypothetical protein